MKKFCTATGCAPCLRALTTLLAPGTSPPTLKLKGGQPVFPSCPHPVETLLPQPLAHPDLADPQQPRGLTRGEAEASRAAYRDAVTASGSGS
ncbi:MAG: hypothetical protein M3Q49_15425, partial [Actinomycetota bacterium]|nr:hypothetical protein [Actinomycetota bacterium]